MRINIDITNHCNKSCSICPMRDRYKNLMFPMGYMDLMVYTDIIDQCSVGTEVDLHKDGEPLMHPHIGWMIKYAKSKNLFTHVVTNGLLLAEKKEEIIDSGLDLLTISIVGEIPYDAVTEFMDFKETRLPKTQLKTYMEYPPGTLPNVDNIIRRTFHHWTDDKKRVSNKPCSKLCNYTAINWDGSWALCCVDYKREVNFFNIKDLPLSKWLQITKKIYEWQEEGLFLAPCTKCNYWEE